MLSRKIRLTLILTSAVLASLLAIGVLTGQSGEQDDLYKKFDIFVEVMNRIRNDYVEQVKPEMIFDGALKGMARMLDSESSYLTAEEYNSYSADNAKRTAETGVDFIKSPGNNYAYVVNVRPDSPAEASGLRAGDFIRAIDDMSTREMPLMLIDYYMRGEPGSTAHFSVLRNNVQGLLTFEVPRENLDQPAVTSRVIDGIGYIHIPTFRSYVLEDVQKACENFVDQGVKTAIIDIRGDIYGDVEEAVHVAELFVSEGPLLSVKSKGETVYYTANDFSYDFDIFLLVNETTGRAAEAFAFALAVRDEATIIGRTSLGLGAVQRDITLEDGAFLRISYGTIVAPDGSELNGVGVMPDIEVLGASDEAESTDIILNKALEQARQQTGKKAA